MCIVFLHYHPSSTSLTFSAEAGGGECACPYILVAAVNRDEFFERATKPLAYWGPDNSILGGQDMHRDEVSERGTWLGVSSNGRLALLTNYRTHASEIQADAKTRGLIVSDFLSGQDTPEHYCTSLLQEGNLYNGFSTIVADLTKGSEVVYCSNRDIHGGIHVLGPGNYGLSNQLLNSPWLKVQRGRAGLEHTLKQPSLSAPQLTEALMDVLADDTCLYPDPNIPDTGFSPDTLKYTSSIFVQPVTFYGHQYGTRTSSVVLVDRSGKVTFTERTRTCSVSAAPDTTVWTTSQHAFNIMLPTIL